MRKTHFFRAILLAFAAAYLPGCGGDSASNTPANNTNRRQQNVAANASPATSANTASNSTTTGGTPPLNAASQQKALPDPTPAANPPVQKTERKDEGLFSFPPPRATAYRSLDYRYLLSPARPPTFENAALKLSSALENAGYDQSAYSYFWSGNDEFAVVTRMERVSEDGEPLGGGKRWDDSDVLPSASGAKQYGNYLFAGRKTFYRVFAFIVTPKNYNFRRNTPPSFEMAREWMNKGEPVLGGDAPGGVREAPLTDRYKFFALLYLFVNHTSLDSPKSIDKLEPAELRLLETLNRDATAHLEKTKINFGE